MVSGVGHGDAETLVVTRLILLLFDVQSSFGVFCEIVKTHESTAFHNQSDREATDREVHMCIQLQTTPNTDNVTDLLFESATFSTQSNLNLHQRPTGF